MKSARSAFTITKCKNTTLKKFVTDTRPTSHN